MNVFTLYNYMNRAPQESMVRTSELQPEENEGPKPHLEDMHVETREWNLWDGTDIFEDVHKDILGRAPESLRTEELQ